MTDVTATATPQQLTEEVEVPHDREVTRGRFARHLWAWSVGLAIVAIPSYLAHLVSVALESRLELHIPLWPLGFVIGLYLIGRVLPYITVIVPLWQGLVTQNVLVNRNAVVYGPGLHPRLSWEDIHRTGHLPLSIATKRVTETIATRDDVLLVSFTVQFSASLSFLARFFGIAASTIEDGFVSIIRNYLSHRGAEMTAVEFRERVASISDDAMRTLRSVLAGEQPHPAGEEASRIFEQVRGFRRRYGVQLHLIRIDDADFSENVQEARSASAAAQPIIDTVSKIQGMDPDMLERAMIISGKGELRKISVGGSAGHAIAAAVANVAGGLGGSGEPQETPPETPPQQRPRRRR